MLDAIIFQFPGKWIQLAIAAGTAANVHISRKRALWEFLGSGSGELQESP
jgi:hypothetical protein